MRLIGQFDFSGIRKVVINRTIVWELIEDLTLTSKTDPNQGLCFTGLKWHKVAGGKGFIPDTYEYTKTRKSKDGKKLTTPNHIFNDKLF